MPEPGEVDQAPIPVLLLSVDVRSETWRSITPIGQLTDEHQPEWADVIAAAFMAWDEAIDASKARGLPAPKVPAATWRGGIILPALPGHAIPAAPY